MAQTHTVSFDAADKPATVVGIQSLAASAFPDGCAPSLVLWLPVRQFSFHAALSFLLPNDVVLVPSQASLLPYVCRLPFSLFHILVSISHVLLLGVSVPPRVPSIVSP